jgi:hypothetical protein
MEKKEREESQLHHEIPLLIPFVGDVAVGLNAVRPIVPQIYCI